MSEELDKKIPRVDKKKELEKRYGILRRHLKQIKEYNERLNWIIMLRPINKDVASKLRSGGRGKIISIKGKSSNFIFLAGDVPFEAGLSKLGEKGGDSNWSAIAHFNSVNVQSLNNSSGKEKSEELMRQIKKLKQQIEEFRQLSPQELQQTQQELDEKQQELRNKTLEYNLNFNLSKIKKIVEIDGKKYESFYKVDEKGHPVYKEYNGRQQPVVYVREKGIGGGYSKIKYDNSERGYSIDTDSGTQIKADSKDLKPIEIFSYEQYEECAISGDKKIRIDNTTKDEFEIEGYYETNTKSKQLCVKAKKEGDNEYKYYTLESRGYLAGQDGIETYEVDSKQKDVDIKKMIKLETTYELINPPLTADYDQLSAARVYVEEENIDGLTDLNSVVEYLKKEQEKLISFPADKYLKECKDAAKRLAEQDFSQEEADTKLLSELLGKECDYITPQECEILKLKFGLLGVCGKSLTKNTMKLGNILDYGISHGLEILHYPPEPIKLKHINGTPDEEFLVIDGEGNPRIAKNLEGVLYFMNDQRNRGICCLEPNPLWPIKVNFNKTPHEIEIDEQQNSPLLINGFYTGIIELQKKLGTQPFADEFIYAERLMLNSDFVPRIGIPNDVSREGVRKIIETDNLIEANIKYMDVLGKLKTLREKAVIQSYNTDFMKFCQNQNLSGSLETNDTVMNVFKKSEVKSYFSDGKNIEILAKEIEQLVKDKKIDEIKEKIKNKILINVNENIKDDVAEVLMDNSIRSMLLSQPDDYALKAKFFDILPNINLLKGFEIKEKANKEQRNFLENLDDYIKLIENKREQIIDRIKTIEPQIKNKDINKIRMKIKANNYRSAQSIVASI